MGLFSFLKNAGAKILGRAAESNDEAMSAEDVANKVSLLKSIVSSSGIEVSDLSVQLG